LAFPIHLRDRRFFNPGVPGPRGVLAALTWMLTGSRESSPRFIPVRPSSPPASVDSPSLVVTMVNHSTVLLQQPGSNILTDPIWSERCSPVPFLGPRRHRPPGVEFDRLPAIHAVLITHNHYDHLDVPTLRRLAARGGCIFIAPLGVAKLLTARGIGPVSELDWGESAAVPGATIHAVPAVHFSARGPFDRNKTLWCGYMVESAFGIVYFAGDTAFGPHFEWIRDRFGPPRLALLPIGAYQPRWFMSPVHMNPAEAVEAHRILGAAASIAIHHGTFQLGDEAIDAPRRALLACDPGGSLLVLDNGETASFI
jgi:L-ascorbate metabolism protein UlaG (beta-lactamase superfamily)